MPESHKSLLRTEALRHRARMRAEDPEEAVGHFFSAVKPSPGAVIAGYWPKDSEFDIRPVMAECLKRGFVCVLPVMKKGERELLFARWAENAKLAKAAFDIYEPPVDEHTEWLEPDIVITPLLAFDRRGYRLGHGYGYYDATLRALRARKKIVAVGAGYSQQAVLFNLPAEAHDERLDWVVTPKGSQDFRGV